MFTPPGGAPAPGQAGPAGPSPPLSITSFPPAVAPPICNAVRTRSVGTNTQEVVPPSMPNSDADFLGPCQPGTSVNLEGIVWHETQEGEANPWNICAWRLLINRSKHSSYVTRFWAHNTFLASFLVTINWYHDTLMFDHTIAQKLHLMVWSHATLITRFHGPLLWWHFIWMYFDILYQYLISWSFHLTTIWYHDTFILQYCVCVCVRRVGGQRDVEEENLCGNTVGLHQTRLGSSQVMMSHVCQNEVNDF